MKTCSSSLRQIADWRRETFEPRAATTDTSTHWGHSSESVYISMHICTYMVTEGYTGGRGVGRKVRTDRLQIERGLWVSKQQFDHRQCVGAPSPPPRSLPVFSTSTLLYVHINTGSSGVITASSGGLSPSSPSPSSSAACLWVCFCVSSLWSVHPAVVRSGHMAALWHHGGELVSRTGAGR